MVQVTLKPGDYVSTAGMTEEQYHQVAAAFMAAGCPRFDPESGIGNGDHLEWWGGELVSTSSVSKHGRHLTIEQVLGAVNAKLGDPHTFKVGDRVRLNGHRNDADNEEHEYGTSDTMEEWEDAGAELTVTYITTNMAESKPLIRASDGSRDYAFHPSELELLGATSGESEEPPTQNTTIATLRLARARLQEAQGAYQLALDAVRAELGEGFVLVEAGEEPAEDMRDPANWREGDILECVDRNGHSWIREGNLYPVISIDDMGWIVIVDDDGDKPSMSPRRFKFHSRPN